MATKTRDQDDRDIDPGKGSLWYKSKGKHEVLQIWEGPGRLIDGRYVRFEAKIVKPEGAKRPRFDILVKQIATKPGDAWKQLAEFSMPGFTKEKQEQIIDIPNVGKAKARIKSAGPGNQFIQIQFENAPRVGHMVPM